MALTWYQFKVETKKLLTDVSASDDLFAQASAAYVKAMICREVDHDLVMAKSYLNTYEDLRRRLLGYTPTLVVGGSLDTAVRLLLPVDDQREGIQSYLTQMIKNSYTELTTLSVLIEKLMREAVIDLQSHIACYRIGQETTYTSSNVTVTGNLSRGPMPEQAEFREAFFLTAVAALAENTAYNPGDYVSSNTRSYMVLNEGTLTTGQLGAGLLTTDGSVETLGSLKFAFVYGEACFRTEVSPIPWENRYALSTLKDGCRGDRDRPPVICIDPESYSFFVWPKLDATHTLTVNWTGLRFDFVDGDNVPFDEAAQEAVREYVLSKYYIQVEHDRLQGELHGAAYASLRARAFVDCKSRKRIQFFK